MSICWYEKYMKLSMQGGKFTPIIEDDEDMFTITYEDGITIDVGYIEIEKSYYITVVRSVDWEKPIEEIAVTEKDKLFEEVQRTIFKYRN